MIKNIFYTILITIISLIFIWWVYGFIIIKNDVIIKQTNTHLYVKQYSWYNNDSIVKIYNKPIIYNGIIVEKNIYKRFVGLLGKGGHYKTYYETIVKYSDTQYIFNDIETYQKYNKLDRVKIVETFYPNYYIQIHK